MPGILHVFTALAAALLVALPASAQEDGRISRGMTAGSRGVGPEIGLRINDRIGLRGSASFLNARTAFGIDDLRYRGRAKLDSAGAVVDVYPFDDGFRLSGGARADNDLTDVSPMLVAADRTRVAPVMTLGYAQRSVPSLKFGIDGGVGGPRFSPLVQLSLFSAF